MLLWLIVSNFIDCFVLYCPKNNQNTRISLRPHRYIIFKTTVIERFNIIVNDVKYLIRSRPHFPGSLVAEPLSLGVAGVRRVKFRSDDMSEKGCTQNYISQYIAVQKKLIHGSRK